MDFSDTNPDTRKYTCAFKWEETWKAKPLSNKSKLQGNLSFFGDGFETEEQELESQVETRK